MPVPDGAYLAIGWPRLTVCPTCGTPVICSATYITFPRFGPDVSCTATYGCPLYQFGEIATTFPSFGARIGEPGFKFASTPMSVRPITAPGIGFTSPAAP